MNAGGGYNGGWLVEPVCGDFDTDLNDILLEHSEDFCTDICIECNKETFSNLENNVSQLQAWTISEKDEVCEPLAIPRQSRKPSKQGSWTMDGFKQTQTQPDKHAYKFKHLSEHWEHSKDYRLKQTYNTKAQRDAIRYFENESPTKDPYFKKLKRILSAYLEKCCSQPETPLAIHPSKNTVSQALRIPNASPYDIAQQPPPVNPQNPTCSTPQGPASTASTLVKLGPEYMRFPSMPHRVLRNDGDELQISSIRGSRSSESFDSAATISKVNELERSIMYSRLPSATSTVPSRRSSASSKSNFDEKRRPVNLNLTPKVTSYSPLTYSMKSNNTRHPGQSGSPEKMFTHNNPYMELYTPKTLLEAMKHTLNGGSVKDKTPSRQFKNKKNAKTKKLGSTEFSSSAPYSHRLSYTQYSPGRTNSTVAVTIHPINTSRM